MFLINLGDLYAGFIIKNMETNHHPCHKKLTKRLFITVMELNTSFPAVQCFLSWNRQGCCMGLEDDLLLFDACADAMYSTKHMHRTDEDWRMVLSPDAYRIAREGGTEVPFGGKYADCHDAGIYACACCGTHLFFSVDKFDSGTGWPSFTQPVSQNNVEMHPDHSSGMIRTEVLCRRCGAHLGHVFDDGPPPARTRYCMNSLSLDLVVCETPAFNDDLDRSGDE